MVEPMHKDLTIEEQCKLLNISRSSYYYTPRNSKEDWEVEMIMVIIEELTKRPFYGYRKIAKALHKRDFNITRKQVRRLMNKSGLLAIYPKRNLSKARKEHKKYPYLLRNKIISFPNQVWATDITYLKLGGKSVYLAAVLDLFSRKVLSWRISNTMDVNFCVDILEEAIMGYGIPAIFNTDQGSQVRQEVA